MSETLFAAFWIIIKSATAITVTDFIIFAILVSLLVILATN